jgi:hypothetical protein
MFSDEQIFERLMKGENIDDIMAEITNKVNAALQKKADADKAAEEAKRKAEEEAARIEMEKIQKAKALSAEKHCAVRELLDAFANVCDLWGWEETGDECDAMTDEDIEDIIAAIDSYGEIMATYAKLAKTTFPLGGTKPVAKKIEIGKNPTVEVKKTETANDIINKFLKGYGLI